MRFRAPALFGFGVVSAFVVSGGAASAVNGAAVLIGRANAATATTSLNNSTGTPLSLLARAGSAPLRVNSATKVAKLNADLLDGVDASALALTSGRSGIITGSADDADGYVNTARCPSGSIATGGGGYASGTRDYLYYSGPDYTADRTLIPNSWFVAADGDTTAWVVCYNPRGPVPGAASGAPDALASRGVASTGGSSYKSTKGGSTQKRLPAPPAVS